MHGLERDRLDLRKTSLVPEPSLGSEIGDLSDKYVAVATDLSESLLGRPESGSGAAGILRKSSRLFCLCGDLLWRDIYGLICLLGQESCDFYFSRYPINSSTDMPTGFSIPFLRVPGFMVL